MSLRKMTLAGSWYPHSNDEIAKMLSVWTRGNDSRDDYVSAVVPHAGWYYSGKIAARAAQCVCGDRELIVIVGGHLPPGHSVLAALEAEFEVPGRKVSNRLDLIAKLRKKINIDEDVYQDNTVEIVLPMASYFAPGADFLWLRAPADMTAVQLAAEVFQITSDENINTALLGSTDLTHYGSNYYFQPAGGGEAALKWVKEENDAGIISRMLSMDAKAVIEHADKNKSACSAGAAAAAMEFARLSGTVEGRLNDYATSYDIRPAESFVGYAGVLF